MTKMDTVQWVYGFAAVFGGIARYLNAYIHGQPFKLSIFLASVVVSGFSGYMFAALGESVAMPQNMLFVTAGIGGYMADQSMKFVMERITGNFK